MKLLKIVVLFFMLASGSSPVFAQVYKFKSTSYSMMEKDPKGKWGKWKPFVESTVVITLDGNKDRVVVGSKELQLFTIITYGQKVSTEFDDTITLECFDNAGGACTISIVTRKNQGNRKQFYINYADVKIVYNVYDSKS